MFWRSLLTILFAALTFPAAQALPQGIVEVYSAYTDVQNGNVKVVKGYGFIVKLVFDSTDAKGGHVFVIQTVSHLSQGGLGPDRLPRTAVKFKLNNGREVVGRYGLAPLATELGPVTNGIESEAMLLGSRFSNVKDSELLIIDPGYRDRAHISELIEIGVERGQIISYEMKIDPSTMLESKDGWRVKKIRKDLGIICPVEFKSCSVDDGAVLGAGPMNHFSHLIKVEGYIQTEYDWLVFTRTEQGMSGLPVVSFMESASNAGHVKRFKSGLVGSVMGAISSSSRQSDETWATFLDPLADFLSWMNAGGQSSALADVRVIGAEKVFWELEAGILRRKLIGENHIYVEWSPDALPDLNSAPKGRCENGGAFRHDNGGDLPGDPCGVTKMATGKGGFKIADSTGRFSKSNLLIMSHPAHTRIVPATVAGMALSHYTKAFDSARLRAGGYAGMTFTEYTDEVRSVRWDPFRELYDSFYRRAPVTGEDRDFLARQKVDVADLVVEKFTGQLNVSKVLRNGGAQVVSDARAQLEILSVIRKDGELAGSFFKLSFEGHEISRWISFSEDRDIFRGEIQTFAPYVIVRFKGKPASLELAGMLSHNPDRMNIPDLRLNHVRAITPAELPAGLKTPVHKFFEMKKIDGDVSIKTVFSLQTENETFYFSLAASQTAKASSW